MNRFEFLGFHDSILSRRAQKLNTARQNTVKYSTEPWVWRVFGWELWRNWGVYPIFGRLGLPENRLENGLTGVANLAKLLPRP